MLNIKYIKIISTFLVISVIFQSALGATEITEILDYSQCKIYFKVDETCTDNGNCTKNFYPVEVCAKSFPKINRHVELTQENPIFILPEYNFSIKISETVFKSVSDEIITNKQKIQDLENSIKELSNKINSQNENINKLKEAFLQEIARIENEINTLNISITSVQQGLMNLSAKSQGNNTLWIAGIVLVGMIIIYLLYRKGLIQKPDFLSNAENMLEEVIPESLEVEKKKKVKKHGKKNNN